MSMIFFAFLSALIPLVSVLGILIRKGIGRLDWEFFTQLPKPIGEIGGGLAHSLLGTLILVTCASLIGLPIGIGCGVMLSEFPRNRISPYLKTAIDLLNGMPSIVVGLFVYAMVVVPFHHFSGAAGSIALAIILIPTLSKTTEEVLKIVPASIREAGLALGIPRWKVILRIVVWGSRTSIVTGAVLALARVAGETAPLLFTSLNADFWPKSLGSPMSTLPVQIFNYAISPFDEWNALAWTGALVLVIFVFISNLLMRWLVR